MKKRFLSGLIVCVISVSLFACGNENTPPTEQTETIESTEQQATEEIPTTEIADSPEVKPAEEPTTEQEIAENTETEAPTAEQETAESTETEAPTAEQETAESTETEAPTTEPTEEASVQYTYTDLSTTMYAQQTVNVRNQPSTDGEKVGSLSTNQEVSVTGQCNETSWYRIDYNGSVAYVSNSYIVAEKAEMIQQTQQTASGECPYPIYQVIDEGGDKVYFYRLWNGNLGNTWAECEQDIDQFWTCWNQCVGILASRHGWVYTYDGPSQTGGNVYEFGPSDETNYYIDGYMVMRARPQCCPNTSTPAEATEIAGWQ